MMQHRDLIVYADDWHGPPSSTVQLVRRLAPHNRVFWFKSVSRMPALRWQDVRTATTIMSRWATQRATPASVPEDNVWTRTAVMMPYFRSPGRRFNRVSLLRQYEQTCRLFRINDPVVLTTVPPVVDLMTQIGPATKLYYCLDEWSQFPGLDHEAWQTMEHELLDVVDGFAATSRRLMQKGRRCPADLYLPQGVDFDHFAQVHRQPQPSIPALETLARPIVGFFGLIAEWVDVALIEEASRRLPHASFLLIGKATVDLRRLETRPNVHRLGPVPYDQLPQYARYFDVGIIPFVEDDLTAAVNPLKLMEYFALGLPVVASGLPELREAPGPVQVACGVDDFCESLAHRLQNSRADREEAISIAAANTWQQRALDFSHFVARLQPPAPAAIPLNVA